MVSKAPSPTIFICGQSFGKMMRNPYASCYRHTESQHIAEVLYWLQFSILRRFRKYMPAEVRHGHTTLVACWLDASARYPTVLRVWGTALKLEVRSKLLRGDVIEIGTVVSRHSIMSTFHTFFYILSFILQHTDRERKNKTTKQHCNVFHRLYRVCSVCSEDCEPVGAAW